MIPRALSLADLRAQATAILAAATGRPRSKAEPTVIFRETAGDWRRGRPGPRPFSRHKGASTKRVRRWRRRNEIARASRARNRAAQ